EAARRLGEAFAGAVWFVPLSDLADPALLGDTIARTMGLPRQATGDPLQQVADALAHRAALLVLDNTEHLLPEAARAIRSLLERAPLLTCLVTSRRRLQLA